MSAAWVAVAFAADFQSTSSTVGVLAQLLTTGQRAGDPLRSLKDHRLRRSVHCWTLLLAGDRRFTARRSRTPYRGTSDSWAAAEARRRRPEDPVPHTLRPSNCLSHTEPPSFNPTSLSSLSFEPTQSSNQTVTCRRLNCFVDRRTGKCSSFSVKTNYEDGNWLGLLAKPRFRNIDVRRPKAASGTAKAWQRTTNGRWNSNQESFLRLNFAPCAEGH